MIYRFPTYSEAWIFAGMKRAEGHHAEVLDEHAALLWVPAITGGFRVMVSEEAAGESELEPPSDRCQWLPAGAEKGVVGLLVLAILAALFWGMQALEHQGGIQIEPALLRDLLLKLAGGAALIFLLIPAFEPMTHALRNPTSLLSILVRIAVIAYFGFSVLYALFAFIVHAAREFLP